MYGCRYITFCICSNDENNPLPDGTSGEVPALVLDEFNSLFPGATNVVWSTKGEYAVANFYWDGSRADNVVRNHTAWFALANGVWGMTEKEIRFADLPEAVKMLLEQVSMDRLRGVRMMKLMC